VSVSSTGGRHSSAADHAFRELLTSLALDEAGGVGKRTQASCAQLVRGNGSGRGKYVVESPNW
jgi:hypothetical protein